MILIDNLGFARIYRQLIQRDRSMKQVEPSAINLDRGVIFVTYNLTKLAQQMSPAVVRSPKV